MILSLYVVESITAETITVSLQDVSASLAFVNCIYITVLYIVVKGLPTRQKHPAMKMLLILLHIYMLKIKPSSSTKQQ